MFKKVLAVIAVLGGFYSAMGQNVEGVNARLDAMGGSGVIGDIGWTIGKPSSLYGYADQVQASGLIITIEGLGKTYGSIIAIKSLGEHFFVGLTMNNRKAMSGRFYSKAMEYGDFGENFNFLTQPGQYFPDYPHLNINIKPSDNLSIGIGGFIEHSKHDEQKTKNLVYNYENTSGDTVENLMYYDSTRFKKYFGIGIIADARIWFGGFKINPEFKIFIPKLEGRVETNLDEKFNKNHNVTQPLTVEDIKDSAKTTDLSKNIFLRAGTKFSGTIAETFWIIGLWYRTERFEIKRDIEISGTVMDYGTNSPYTSSFTSTFHAHKKNRFDWWIGSIPSFSDNLIISPEYSGFVQRYEITPSSGYTEDTTTVRIKHKFRLGAEQSIKGFWVFKELFLRMGINYYLTRDYWKNKNGLSPIDSTTETIYWPYSSNNDLDLTDDGKGAKITAGFGLKGKRGTFDLSLDILNWSNTGITGPGAAIATFGLDFGRKEKK